VHGAARENAILAEQVLLLARPQVVKPLPRTLFPDIFEPPRGTLLVKTGTTKAWTLAGKSASGNDNYYRETSKGFEPVFKLGPRRSALGGAPEDESGFPVLTWLKRTLVEGVQTLALNSALMRMPSPPGQKRGLRPDGSNLPWVIADLLAKAPARAEAWIDHLRTALPDLLSIRTVERPEDRHRYLVVGYRGGLEAPSWVVSDGTLRLLALTLPAYLPDLRGIYLIEEPENGIHPRAVETMFQSLSSVYDAQVLLATHSPVILSLAQPEQVLCFGRTGEGAADIVRGPEHPALRDWKGDPNLSVLYAAGVLG
jgi:hypothetical protein